MDTKECAEQGAALSSCTTCSSHLLNYGCKMLSQATSNLLIQVWRLTLLLQEGQQLAVPHVCWQGVHDCSSGHGLVCRSHSVMFSTHEFCIGH